jgi:short-subunit dehydrogenase
VSDDLPFASALITGASSGIGEAMVHALGRAGVPMVLVARREDRLRALAGQYPGVSVLVADLSERAALGAVVERLVAEHEPIDLLVNDAGFGTSGEFHGLDAERLDREVRLNVGAVTALSRAALGVMVPRGRGYVLNVSSVAGFQPAPRLAVYAATKAYVTNLSESLHQEVAGSGVHVTALCPGLTRTEFQQVSNPDRHASWTAPRFAWLDVDAVAAAGLRDVARGKALCVPGALYKVIVAASGVTPRAVLRRASAKLKR